MKKELLRKLPSVDFLLKDVKIAGFLKERSRPIVVEAIRTALDKERELIKGSDATAYRFNIGDFRKKVGAKIEKSGRLSLARVVNATGVILHTNLGRAPLSVSALNNLIEVSTGYANLEFDLEKGERGERYSHLEPLLCRLTGSEAALVVNNNAAAVLLVLNTLAEGKEVIVSRGELVEIGGSFRIPDVMRKSGTRLIEVGTTNRTHLKDYEAALTPETALIMKVHRSNFDMVGFTADVPIQDLVKLGKDNNITVMNDLGSGSLIDLSGYGLKREPTVQDSVAGGIDIITFSGDKLLGGPQAGIIIGKKEVIAAIKKNPLTRALRIDKLTVAALEATLKIYLDELKALHEIPVLRMLTLQVADLAKTARSLLKGLRGIPGGRFEVSIRDGFSQVGGGAMPLQEIPTKLVVIKAKGISPNRLEKKLRTNSNAIVARIERDEVVFDMRTLNEGDIEIITGFFKGASIG